MGADGAPIAPIRAIRDTRWVKTASLSGRRPSGTKTYLKLRVKDGVVS